MRRKALYLVGAAAGAFALGAAAQAGETTTFSYDALGRLVRVSTAGGPQNGRANALCYDAAGNRTQYRSSGTGAVAGCGAPPPPAPPAPTSGGQ